MDFVDPDGFKDPDEFVDPDKSTHDPIAEYSQQSLGKRLLTGPIGTAETAANLITSIPEFVTNVAARGVTGLSGAIQGKSVDDISKSMAETGQKVHEAAKGIGYGPFTAAGYQPQTAAGQAQTELLGKGFQTAIEGTSEGTTQLIASVLYGYNDWMTPEQKKAQQDAQQAFKSGDTGKAIKLITEFGLEAGMAVGGAKSIKEVGSEAYKRYQDRKGQTPEEINLPPPEQPAVAPPEDIGFWKNRAEQITQDARNTPYQVSADGQIIPKELTDATRDIDSQAVQAPQYGQEQRAQKTSELLAVAESIQKDIIKHEEIVSDPQASASQKLSSREQVENFSQIAERINREIKDSVEKEGVQEPKSPPEIIKSGRYDLDHREFLSDAAGATKLDRFVKSDGTINPFEVLDNLSRDSARGDYKKLAGELLEKHSDLVKGILVKAEQGIDGSIVGHFLQANGNKSAGFYNSISHSIHLSGAGLNSRAFMHELIHGLTVHGIEASPRLAKDLEAIRQQALKVSDPKEHYGLTNTKEMVAEAITNRDFQKFLQDKSTQGFSLWQRFVNSLSNFLTGKPKFSDLLSKTLSLTDEAIAAQKELSSFKDRTINEPPLSQMAPVFDILGNGAYSAAKFVEGSNIHAMRWESPLAKGKQQERAISKIPGLKAELLDYISPDLDPKKVIEQALEESDSTGSGNVIGGGYMKAIIKKSSAIYGVQDWFTNGNKRSAYLDREYVVPVEKVVNRILSSPKNTATLMKIITEESERQVRFTPEQLKQAGTRPEIIEAHEGFRQMMDKALSRQNTALRAIGEKEITAREGYASARRTGNWQVPVYDKENKLVWYYREKTEERAKDALAYLSHQFDDLDPTKSTIEHTPIEVRGGDPVETGYREMLRILGDKDPAVAAMKEAYDAYQESIGYKALNQSQHFLPKSGIRGAVGDRPWKDPHRDATEFLREQFKYARNAFRWSEIQAAVSKAKEIFSDETLQQLQPNNIAIAKEIAKNQLGYITLPEIATFERRIGKEISRYIPVSANQVMGTAKSLFYIKQLGVFNVPFTIASVLQPVFTAPWHTKLTVEGYGHNAAKTMLAGISDGIALVRDHMGLNSKMDSFTREASNYTKANGIIDINQFSDIKMLGRPKALQHAETFGGMNMIASEMMSRSMAFMGFAHHLKASGKFKSNAEIFKKAEDLTNLSMVDYRHFERAGVFNKLGTTGEALSTLQTFKINQLNQLYHFGQEARKSNFMGKSALPMYHLIATQLVMAGTLGFFGVQTLDAIWELIKKGLPDGTFAKVKDLGIKQTLLKTLPDWANYGGFSKLTGVNFSSRFDAGTIVDVQAENLFPFISDLIGVGKAVKNYAGNPNEATKAQLAYQASPASLKGLVDEQMFAKGEQPGGTLYASTQDWTKGKLVRDDRQKLLRMFGMRDLAEAQTSDSLYKQNQLETQLKHRQDDVKGDFLQSIVAGDIQQAEQNAKLYIDLEGDPNTLFSGIKQAIVDANLTALQRIYIKANSYAGAKKAQRYKQNVQ